MNDRILSLHEILDASVYEGGSKKSFIDGLNGLKGECDILLSQEDASSPSNLICHWLTDTSLLYNYLTGFKFPVKDVTAKNRKLSPLDTFFLGCFFDDSLVGYSILDSWEAIRVCSTMPKATWISA